MRDRFQNFIDFTYFYFELCIKMLYNTVEQTNELYLFNQTQIQTLNPFSPKSPAFTEKRKEKKIIFE